MKRREFAKQVWVAVMLAPFAGVVRGEQEKETPKNESKLKLTAAQEAAVKKATEQREKMLAGVRSRVLPYDLEPAFVFVARPRPRPSKKKS